MAAMSQTRRYRRTSPTKAPKPTMAEIFKARLGWKPSTTPFYTTANRECGSCHAIKRGSEFDVPVTRATLI